MNQIAIVILNWNGSTYLKDFLPSVIQYSENAHIVVADNASTDDSVAFLQTHYPQIEIIRNTENGGFARGYNEALQSVDSKYYLLLNSDVEVTENWLVPLLAAMDNPLIAGCQPKVLSFSQRHKFEHAGAAGGFLDRNYFPFCRGRIFEETEIDSHQYDGETEVFWASGACMLIRSELFHYAGGFDEAFFAHMEEIDLCWRIKRMGYGFLVVPASHVFHVGGGTLDYLSPKKTYLNFRNSLFMITKNHAGRLFPKLFYRMSLDGVAAVTFLLKGKPKHFAAVFNAHVDFYKQLKNMLQQRQALNHIAGDFNETGLYHGSILWAKYFKRIHEFRRLNMRFFRNKNG